MTDATLGHAKSESARSGVKVSEAGHAEFWRQRADRDHTNLSNLLASSVSIPRPNPYTRRTTRDCNLSGSTFPVKNPARLRTVSSLIFTLSSLLYPRFSQFHVETILES